MRKRVWKFTLRQNHRKRHEVSPLRSTLFSLLSCELDLVHTGPDPYGHHINLKSQDEHHS